MSYTTIYKVYKTKAVPITELKNSWGSAPPLWDFICEKYLDLNKTSWLSGGNKKRQKLWDAYKNKSIPIHLRFGLLFTLTGGIVTLDNLLIAGKHCKTIHDTLLTQTKWTWSHWKEMSETLINIHKKHDPRMLGMGLGCTSICDPWEKYPKGTKAWDIFEEV